MMKLCTTIPRTLVPATALLSLFFVLTAQVSPSWASGPTHALTPQLASEIRENMTKDGITGSLQDSLVMKLDQGEQLDSSTGADPVETRTENSATTTTVVRAFEDGSTRSTVTDKPDTAKARTGLSGCSTSSGWKVGCKVSVWDPISSAKFTIDYQTSSTGKARVRSFRGASCSVVGIPSSCSLPSPTGITRATQSPAGAAWARLTYRARSGPLQATGEFGIRVTGTKASVY